MIRSTVLSSVLVLGLAAVGCGPMEEEDKGIIGEENSEIAGDSLQASIEGGAGHFAVEDGATPFGATCYAFSGNTADFDGDSIPAEITLTLQGCAETNLYGTATANGVASVRDENPDLAAYFFSANADLSLDIIGSNGGTLSANHVSEVRGTQPGSEFQLDVEGTNTLDADHGENSFSASESLDWVEHYAPTAAWIPGQDPVAGSYTVEGSWFASVDSSFGSGEADAMITTSVPMTIDPSCETLVVAGSVQAAYEGPDELRNLSVTWTGCGQGSVTYSETPAGS